MHFDDGENGAGPQADSAQPTPAADFGRRRVSRILMREKPRREQKDDNEFRASDEVFRMLEESPHTGTTMWVFKPGLNVDVLCRWKRTLVWASSQPIWCHRIKAKNANLNSRFLGRPF